jgi:hypothetical protein
MAKTASFTKRNLIDKANSTIVIATATAAFLVVFGLVASRALVSQMNYQNRVITAKKQALTQLESDLAARDSLVSSYKAFVNTPQNVLSGNPEGTGDNDGDNAKIVLDALPSKYDFPALTSSLEKLVRAEGMQVKSLTGTDDEVAQAENATSADPKPIALPFELQASGSYGSTRNLVNRFERSIRPFVFHKLSLSGDEGNMNMTITAQTFYQPEKSLKITTEEIQ